MTAYPYPSSPVGYMLFDNKDYTAFLQTWGNLHSYLRVFALITVKIAGSIQWILRSMYQIVNKTYMGLSREMEFHADAVAASVSAGITWSVRLAALK
jgi:Zn-dependent protease with chaperone function